MPPAKNRYSRIIERIFLKHYRAGATAVAFKIGAVQIEQDFAVCREKYPDAIGRPIAAQFLDDGTIVLFEFTQTDEGVRVESEKHYRLVPPGELSVSELQEYRQRLT